MDARLALRLVPGCVAGTLGLALLAGCGGGAGSEPTATWLPGEGAAGRASAIATSPTRPARPAGAGPSPQQPALEPAGEIELARGSVQRVYRVRFRNGPRAQTGVVAQLLATGSSAEVIDGRVVVGDLAPGAVVMPADTITLRHAGELVIEAGALRWHITETGEGGGIAGVLLLGAPQEPAIAALRDYALPATARLDTAAVGTTSAAAAGARLSAVLRREATVEQVNGALRSVGGRIAQMRPGNRSISLRLPDPGGTEALQRLAQRLREAKAFESVTLPAAYAAASGPEAPPDPEPDFNDHRDR